MSVLQAIILGVVQGLTEFLPISSSGHLIVFPELFGWDVSSITFDVAIHVATLGAILVALWEDVVRLSRQTLLKVLAATLPAVIIGLFLKDWLESFRTMFVVGIMLAVWGVILFLAETWSRQLGRHVPQVEKMTWTQAMIIGAMQVLAFFPGTSRSGVTMSTGLFTGLSKETAARFSFLLAVPAILGAGTLTGIDVLQQGLDVSLGALCAGFLAAFVSGILAIRLLFLVIRRWSFLPFAVYRVLFGALLIFLALR